MTMDSLEVMFSYGWQILNEQDPEYSRSVVKGLVQDNPITAMLDMEDPEYSGMQFVSLVKLADDRTTYDSIVFHVEFNSLNKMV